MLNRHPNLPDRAIRPYSSAALGLIDHVAFLRGMQRVCPEGHVLIEHIPPERYAGAVKRLKAFSERAGVVWDEPPGKRRKVGRQARREAVIDCVLECPYNRHARDSMGPTDTDREEHSL